MITYLGNKKKILNKPHNGEIRSTFMKSKPKTFYYSCYKKFFLEQF